MAELGRGLAIGLIGWTVGLGAPAAVENGADYVSREAASGAPELVVQVGAGQDPRPPAPARVRAIPMSSTEVVVAWRAPGHAVGVTGYHLYRRGAPIATVAGTSHTDRGLTPATTYAYRVAASDGAGNDGERSRAARAKTPPAPTSVRFAVIGDYGMANAAEAAVAALIDDLDVDFIITTGDNRYRRRTMDQAVGRYFSRHIGNYAGDHGPGSRVNHFFPSIGNHDVNDGGGIEEYLDYFTLPGNERYYEFRRGPVHFFALDSDRHEPDGRTKTSDQAQWLRAALAASDAPHRVVYMHHPPYSSAYHGPTKAMRWPFEKWGATLVLAGHEHVYERIRRDDDGDGVELDYVVNGLGGADLYEFDRPVDGSVFRYNDDHGAMVIEADETSMTLELHSLAAGGTLIERHRIRPDRRDVEPPPVQ